MDTDAPRCLRILVIGSFPPPLGGCTVTLQHLLDELRKRSDVTVRTIDTSRIRGASFRGFCRLARAMWRTLWESFRADVVTLHSATPAVPIWGFWVWSVAGLAGKPFVLRKFAGTDHRSLGWWRGRLAHWVVSHADLYLAETRERVREAEQSCRNRVRWLPTNRPVTPATAATEEGSKTLCRKFVYVGQVRRYKGIRELVAAVARCRADVSVDFYGPRYDDISDVDLAASPRTRYLGVLAPSDVVPTLRRYHASILPTTAATEGYPGAVLESYLAGLPMIASACGAIPEIVDDTSGILVPPGDVGALAHAIDRLALDEHKYRQLCQGVRRKRDQFSSDAWCDRFVLYCREAVRGASCEGSSKSGWIRNEKGNV